MINRLTVDCFILGTHMIKQSGVGCKTLPKLKISANQDHRIMQNAKISLPKIFFLFSSNSSCFLSLKSANCWNRGFLVAASASCRAFFVSSLSTKTSVPKSIPSDEVSTAVFTKWRAMSNEVWTLYDEVVEDECANLTPNFRVYGEIMRALQIDSRGVFQICPFWWQSSISLLCIERTRCYDLRWFECSTRDARW